MEMQDTRLHPDLLKRTSVWLRLNIKNSQCGKLFSVDDGESTKRQNCELECENGRERDWSEEATVDGNGPMVEALAQDWSSLDREVQHERADCHPRTSARLGWSRCHIGLLGNLRECFEMSEIQWWRWRQLHWKEVETDNWGRPHPTRFNSYRWEDMVSTEVSKFSRNADGFAESVHLSTGWLQLGQGDNLQNGGKAQHRRGQCYDTVEMRQRPRGSKRTQQAGGTLFADGFV